MIVLNTNKLSYTGRDISAIRKNIISNIPKITDKWTDFNESDIGMAYIETLAGAIDLLGYYLDKQALENYLPTVTQAKNARAILSIVGNKLKMASSSKCTAKFYLDSEEISWRNDILIPKYTTVSSKSDLGSVRYFTMEDSYLPKGSHEVEIPVMEGIVHTINCKVKDITKQKILLTGGDVALGSVTVEIDGEKWTEVPDVFLSQVQGKEFSVDEDKDNRAYIKLSYAYKELMPVNKESKVVITYAVTSGESGKIGKGVLVNIVDKLHDTEGQDVTDSVRVINLESSSGGSDREDLESARSLAPKVVRTMYTAVTLNDYEVLTNNHPGVLKAKAIDWSIPGEYVAKPYTIVAYVVPTDGGEVSQVMKDELETEIRKRSVSCNTYEVKTAEYVPVDIVADVYCSNNKQLAEDIRRGLEKELENYFKASNQDFGQGYNISKLYALLQTYHPGIRYVELKKPTTDSVMKLNQFPVLGDVTIKVIPQSDGVTYGF